MQKTTERTSVERTSVRPHYRCGIGRKREHEPHTFRALLMASVVQLRCPGYRRAAS